MRTGTVQAFVTAAFVTWGMSPCTACDPPSPTALGWSRPNVDSDRVAHTSASSWLAGPQTAVQPPSAAGALDGEGAMTCLQAHQECGVVT